MKNRTNLLFPIIGLASLCLTSCGQLKCENLKPDVEYKNTLKQNAPLDFKNGEKVIRDTPFNFETILKVDSAGIITEAKFTDAAVYTKPYGWSEVSYDQEQASVTSYWSETTHNQIKATLPKLYNTYIGLEYKKLYNTILDSNTAVRFSSNNLTGPDYSFSSTLYNKPNCADVTLETILEGDSLYEDETFKSAFKYVCAGFFISITTNFVK